jgi:hypothetical protein
MRKVVVIYSKIACIITGILCILFAIAEAYPNITAHINDSKVIAKWFFGFIWYLLFFVLYDSIPLIFAGIYLSLNKQTRRFGIANLLLFIIFYLIVRFIIGDSL